MGRMALRELDTPGAQGRETLPRRVPMPAARSVIARTLAEAGIEINGARPWDLRVHDERLWRRVLGDGSLGFGEAYMDGWWDCERIDQLADRALRAGLERRLPNRAESRLARAARWLLHGSSRRPFEVGERHYDIGDDLYERMLDSRMIYSCAYWRDAADLEGAQRAKLDLVCRKLRLEPGMRVLDVGCGWGGAARFAAERYGVRVTGITVSRHQAEAARERCRGLPVEILFDDYRNLRGRFERIYSLGMFEHVGAHEHRRYLARMRELLVPDGLFLLHTIGSNVSSASADPWILKYIFPNSLIPSRGQIDTAAEGLWVIEDWHQFGDDYERTLLEWSANFQRGWPELAARYGERFRRMWHYWLMVSAGAFRARQNQLWQILMSPHGVPGGCAEVR